jgi:hypothetical protein
MNTAKILDVLNAKIKLLRDERNKKEQRFEELRRERRKEGIDEKRHSEIDTEINQNREEIYAADVEIKKLAKITSIIGQAGQFLEQIGMAKQMYTLGKDQFLPVIAEVADIGEDVIETLTKVLLENIIKARENLEPQLNKLSELDAKTLNGDYKNLAKHFGKQKAFQIILARSSSGKGTNVSSPNISLFKA